MDGEPWQSQARELGGCAGSLEAGAGRGAGGARAGARVRDRVPDALRVSVREESGRVAVTHERRAPCGETCREVGTLSFPCPSRFRAAVDQRRCTGRVVS